MGKRLLITALCALGLLSCTGQRSDGDFTSDELALLHTSDSIMRVLTIADSLDLQVLRSQSTDLSEAALVNGNQKCSDFGNIECSIFGIKTTVLLASAVQ